MEDDKDLAKYVRIRRLTDIYYDVQDVRIRTANRLRGFPIKSVIGFPDELLKIEKKAKKQLEFDLKGVPIYMQWLKKIKGIGPCLSGGLISIIMIKFELRDSLDDASDVQKQYALKTKEKKFRVPTIRGIGAFANVSKLWKFAGLDVVDGHAPRRTHGKTVSYSPRLQVLCWKIAESFVKTGDFYRKQYDEFRKMEDARDFICEKCLCFLTKTKLIDLGIPKKIIKDIKNALIMRNEAAQYVEQKFSKAKSKKFYKEMAKFEPKQCIKGHRYARAKRKTVKMFLAHLFDQWYKLEGLTPPKPYAHSFLGHSEYIPAPFSD